MPRRAPWIAALLLAAPAARTAAPPPLTTGGAAALHAEAPAGLDLDAASCGRCHRATYAAWSQSQHASAFRDPFFRASWDRWPNGWCLNCHLPLDAAQAKITYDGQPAVPGMFQPVDHSVEGLPSQGVSCAVCHLRDGEILTADRPSWMARLAHPVREEPALGSAEFCGGCHDFNFQNHTPRQPWSIGDEPLQDTLDEWRSSTYAAEGLPCQGCHMRRGRHEFNGGHDLALLARTLSVAVQVEGEAATVTLTARGAGHRVPTGDPFRRLELALCGDPDCGEVVGQARFHRAFQADAQTWRLVEDTTVPPPNPGREAARSLSVPVRAPPVAWQLWYGYGDDQTLGALPPERARALVASGALEAPTESR